MNILRKVNSSGNITGQEELLRECCVCGGDTYDFWFKPAQSPGPIVQCNECGFVYVNPIESVKSLILEGPILFDRSTRLLESSNIEDIHGSWEEPIIQSYLSELNAKKQNSQDALHHINDVISNRGTILDIGCFCGVFLSVAAQDGWDCFGIEPLVMPAIYARGNFGLRVTTDTLRPNVYPSNFFDVVTAFQVFEHMMFPQDTLDIIYKILKPGGLLLIEVPNIDTIVVKLMGAKHRHFVQDHVSFFSIKTLSHLLKYKGFQIRTAYYPTRIISLNHFIMWLERFNGGFFKGITHGFCPELFGIEISA